MLRSIALGCAVLAATSFSCLAAPKIAIGIIPGLIGPEETAATRYQMFLNRFNKSSKLYLPMARADLMFNQKKVDCIFPANTKYMNNRSQLIESSPIAINRAYVFSFDKSINIDELADKVIAKTRGLSFGSLPKLNGSIVVETRNEENTLHLLLKERVDAVLAYEKDFFAVLKKLNIQKEVKFDKTRPLYQTTESLVCYRSSDGSKLIGQADQFISEINE